MEKENVTVTVVNCSLEELKEAFTEIVRKEVKIPEKDSYLMKNEVAARLSISVPTVNKYIAQGRLRAYRFGRRVLLKESEIASALDQIAVSKYQRFPT